MVTEIASKVQNSVRNIKINDEILSEECSQIRVVSTYEADANLMKAVKDSEETLRQTRSFRNHRGSLFKFVKKVGPNIKSKVNCLKNQALDSKKGGAIKCNGPGCKTCNMINQKPSLTIRNKVVKLMKGSCKSSNICYLAQCKLCKKPYTGRTVVPLNSRINGHRYLFKDILRKARSGKLDDIDTTNDLYTLGLHLHLDHGLVDPEAFDRNIVFGILEFVNPIDIERKEFQWMHRLNTFQPIGLNVEYPFGIPLLGQN